MYRYAGTRPNIMNNQIYIYLGEMGASILPYTTIKITNTPEPTSPFNNQIFIVAAIPPPDPEGYYFYTTSTNGLLSNQLLAGCNSFTVNIIQQQLILYLPTSSAGLPAGSVWRNGNVLNIVWP